MSATVAFSRAIGQFTNGHTPLLHPSRFVRELHVMFIVRLREGFARPDPRASRPIRGRRRARREGVWAGNPPAIAMGSEGPSRGKRAVRSRRLGRDAQAKKRALVACVSRHASPSIGGVSTYASKSRL